MCEIDEGWLRELKEKRYLLSLSPFDLGREIAILLDLQERYKEEGDEERLEWVEAELEKRLVIEKRLYLQEDEMGGGGEED